MINQFCWTELHSTDLDSSKSFFSQLFDWQLQDVEMDGQSYTFINIDDEEKGGMMAQMQEGAQSMFLTYVQVDDLVAKTEQVKALGGSIMMANQEAGEFGSFSVVQDPTGAVFALWKPKS